MKTHKGVNIIDSQYDDYNLAECKTVEAVYIEPISHEDRGNPYIEALPRPRVEDRVIREYTRILPNYRYSEISSLSKHERLIQLNDIKKIRFPLQFHEELEVEFYSALVRSYRDRYSMISKFQSIKYYVNNIENITDRILVGDQSEGTNAGFSLIGYSGCGKSSALKILLTNYPQVITHRIDENHKFTQIVYLVVNCIPNSNFTALYDEIGDAIDKALGNIEPLYYTEISKTPTLGKKSEKIRRLIELFGIGIIIFDEIQLIDFNKTRENTFESLMILSNKTKVAIAVVGTEDAKNEMFKQLRTARRIGVYIDASLYCRNKDYFGFIVHKLFCYQWFYTFVELNDEIVDTLYDLTCGIIDQLISLYIVIHYELLNNKKQITLDRKTITDIFDKYYPNMRNILTNVKNDLNKEQALAKIKKEADEILNIKINALRQKESANKIMNYKFDDMMQKVIINIQNFSDFKESEIIDAYNKVMKHEENHELSEKELNKAVLGKLMKIKKADTKEKKTKKPKISITEIDDYLGL